MHLIQKIIKTMKIIAVSYITVVTNGLSNNLFLKCSLKSGSVSQQSFRHSRQNKGNYSCLIKKLESTAKFSHLVKAMQCNKDVFVFNPWYAKILPCRVILLTLIFVDIAVL